MKLVGLVRLQPRCGPVWACVDSPGARVSSPNPNPCHTPCLAPSPCPTSPKPLPHPPHIASCPPRTLCPPLFALPTSPQTTCPHHHPLAATYLCPLPCDVQPRSLLRAAAVANALVALLLERVLHAFALPVPFIQICPPLKCIYFASPRVQATVGPDPICVTGHYSTPSGSLPVTVPVHHLTSPWT